MSDKDKLTRQLEKLEGEVRKAVEAVVPDRVERNNSKAYTDWLYSHLQWNTATGWIKRLVKVADKHPGVAAATAPFLPVITELASAIANLVAADKKRKLDKRNRPKPIELNSGVKIKTHATHEDVKILLVTLDTERTAHIEEAAEDEARLVDRFIGMAAEGKLSDDGFRMFGIYPRRGQSNLAECVAQLNLPETKKIAIARAKREAAYDFDSFVVKLAGKIAGTKTGPVRSASLVGSTWTGSRLTVLTIETQVWQTKRIVNHSPLGKAFYQWPTIRK